MHQSNQGGPEKHYCIHLSPGEGRQWPPIIRIRADGICEGEPLTLKLAGEVVARIRAEVSAWWVDEEKSS